MEGVLGGVGELGETFVFGEGVHGLGLGGVEGRLVVDE